MWSGDEISRHASRPASSTKRPAPQRKGNHVVACYLRVSGASTLSDRTFILFLGGGGVLAPSARGNLDIVVVHVPNPASEKIHRKGVKREVFFVSAQLRHPPSPNILSNSRCSAHRTPLHAFVAVGYCRICVVYVHTCSLLSSFFLFLHPGAAKYSCSVLFSGNGGKKTLPMCCGRAFTRRACRPPPTTTGAPQLCLLCARQFISMAPHLTPRAGGEENAICFAVCKAGPSLGSLSSLHRFDRTRT